jgi:hypothetical protein
VRLHEVASESSDRESAKAGRESFSSNGLKVVAAKKRVIVDRAR